jgi:hypothetical protein
MLDQSWSTGRPQLMTPEQRDALVAQYDLIWAIPPCQRYTTLRLAPGRHRDANLITPTRELLVHSG